MNNDEASPLSPRSPSIQEDPTYSHEVIEGVRDDKSYWYGWKSEREIKDEQRTKKERQSDIELWENTHTYSDVMEANMSFLRGDISYTPCNAEPLDLETEPLVPDLIALHKYGFFTITSQPADYQFLQRTRSSGSYFVQFEQRAVLEFLIPGNSDIIPQHAYKKFLRLVKEQHQWEVFFGSLYPKAKVLHHSSDDEGVATIRKRKATTKKGVSEEEWKECGHYKFPVDGDEILDFQYWIDDSLQSLKDAIPLMVCLVSKDWNPQMEIEPLLLKLADKAGITPKFGLQSSE
ncbi:MAG: hypothetical protein Q9165_008841 [Trypethelium subeluteriae]